MTVRRTDVVEDCASLRQGDVISGSLLPFHADDSGARGVAILSQTCDVVQPSKVRILVAPVIESNDQSLKDARKGRKPLHLFLTSGEVGGPRPCIVDMERATSVLKSDLMGATLLARYVPEASSAHAGDTAARVGRAFNRFPFPDEVYPFFRELRSRAQSKSGTPSAFGQVIDLVEDLRVSADQWADPGRRLKIYVVVAQERLNPRDDFDPAWRWGHDRVKGARAGEDLDSLKLARVCELVLANEGGDATTLGMLWIQFGECLVAELLEPYLNTEVSECQVEVLSDAEMTYRQYQRTESMDLEVLSSSSTADAA